MGFRDIFGPKLAVQCTIDGVEWRYLRLFELDQRADAEEYVAWRLASKYHVKGTEYRIVTTERQDPCWAF
jgi:hypothetical protein